MNKGLLSILFLCLTLSSAANHFTGAHLRYEYIATNTYRLHLTLYKTCETGAIDLPTFIGVYAESKQNNLVVNRNLVRISTDTLQPFCAGTITSCTNISATYPGYIAGVYTETIQLPAAANDWYFAFSNSNRNFGITNLQSASTQSFYVDAPAVAFLQNTSAVMPDYPPHAIFMNDSVKIPLTAYDADGDSVGYEFIQPLSGQNMPIPYYTGFTVASPFGTGGLCYIDASNNMILKSTAVGKYTVALKIKEYRNGQLVGYTIRDFIIICTNAGGGSTLTTPTPISSANMVTYTCPGRNNQLLFNFTDGNPADSVFLEVTTPTLPGWNFTTSSSNGVGTAMGSITWQTPPSVNPAQLPFFNITVTATDNSCRLKGKATYIYKVLVRDCSADSVWPGDANADKIVDMYDPLAVAINYNDTGAARPGATVNWTGQYCDFWNGSFLNNIDKKHSDCNGDGTVDTADLAAIGMNYGKTHPKGPRRKTTGNTELYFDHSGINPNPDSVVSIKIMLGSSTNPVSQIYGLAANVLVDGLSLSTPPTITYSSSWLGSSSNTLNFTKDVSPTSIDWAYARTDKQDVNGQGILANLEFRIPASTPGGTLVTLSYDRTKFINHEGLELADITTLEDTFYVRHPAAVNQTDNTGWQINIYPNPSKDFATLSISSTAKTDANIAIKDIAGRTISIIKTDLKTGGNNIELSAGKLTPGIYLVHISTAGYGEKVVKWIVQ
ncbi:MAG TPA: T9SS type A sorting domain-containing protein [Flavipsychrobacter sp.]